MNTMPRTESLFVEEVSALAAAPTCPFGHGRRPAPAEGDPEAEAILAEARAAIYYWPETFGGFRCEVSLYEGASEWHGRLEVRTSRNYDLSLDAPEARWARAQIEEMVAHRESPNVSRMILKAGAGLGDWDATYGRRIDLLNDPMKSFYRIKDRRITQIGRHYKGQVLLINIDQHVQHQDRFASLAYTAFYWGQDDGHMRQTETYLDSYKVVDGLLLPESRRFGCADVRGCVTRWLRFDDVVLL